MARVNKMSVLKRQRERKKAEKAAIKRESRARRMDEGEGAGESEPGSDVATRDDLAGYGLLPDPDEPEEDQG